MCVWCARVSVCLSVCGVRVSVSVRVCVLRGRRALCAQVCRDAGAQCLGSILVVLRTTRQRAVCACSGGVCLADDEANPVVIKLVDLGLPEFGAAL